MCTVGFFVFVVFVMCDLRVLVDVWLFVGKPSLLVHEVDIHTGGAGV